MESEKEEREKGGTIKIERKKNEREKRREEKKRRERRNSSFKGVVTTKLRLSFNVPKKEAEWKK